jgi:serine/threonine-protein kinase
MKCTQKNHQRRYPNCEALIMDLKRSLVDPEGDFVQSSVYAAGAVDETVVMSSEDMEKIQRRASHTGNYPKIDEDVYDDEDDDALEYDDDDYDDDEDYDYDRKRRSSGELDPNTKRITKILMVVAAIIIGFIVLFMVGKAMGLFQFESKIVSEEKAVQVTVPNILGYTQEDAREELSLKNLGMKVAGQETSDKYEKGQIIRQEPEASTKVDKNTEVKVYISLGKEEELVVVPDVVSYKEDDAQKLLTSKGLVVEFDYDYHDYIEEGKVIQTTPGKGAEVKEGSTITILVSQGIEKIEMVSVLGKTLEEATKILTDAEFEVGTVTEDYSNEYDSGLVMTQSVESGKKTGKGTKVNLVISKGCKDKVSTVPSLAGKTQNEAIRALESAGLKSGYISFEYSSSVMQGYVINQSASPGSEMEKYSMVDFVVSLGPEPSQETQSSN